MVTKDIPAWSLALGSPAKVVKYFPGGEPEE
jgi:acetyltransferase-like isoleucine patch superfamily enzyme